MQKRNLFKFRNPIFRYDTKPIEELPKFVAAEHPCERPFESEPLCALFPLPVEKHRVSVDEAHDRVNKSKVSFGVQRNARASVINARTIHRVTVYKFLARYPWLDASVDGLAHAPAVRQYGLILLRHGLLAIQRRVASAHLVCKMEGGYIVWRVTMPLSATAASPRQVRYV